jgi:hypothetical protein
MPNTGIITLITAAALWACPLLADEWFDKQRQVFDDFGQQSNARYGEFRDARDAEFTRWLAEQWREFEQFTGEVRDPAPKPAVQPALSPATRKATRAVAEKPAAPVRDKPPQQLKPAGEPSQAIKLTFLGQPVAIQYNAALSAVRLPPAARQQEFDKSRLGATGPRTLRAHPLFS